MAELEEFDPETSADLIQQKLPTVHSVLSAIIGLDAAQKQNEDEPQASQEQEDSEDDQPREDDTATPHFQLHGQRGRPAVVSSCAHTLLFARNSRCNRWPMQLSVDLVGARVPRRSCELLSRLGFIGSWRSSQRLLENMAKDDHARIKRLV